MRLRSGNNLSLNTITNKGHSIINLTLDIILLSKKNISDNIIKSLIESICDLLHFIFKINFINSYPKEKLSHIMDYIYCSNIMKNKTYNKRHLNHILEIYKIFKNKITEDNILNCEFIQNKEFVYIFSLVFYYFQMIFVESLYQDLLDWSDIRIFMMKYVNNNKYFKKHNSFNIEQFLISTINISNKFIADDRIAFSIIRRLILKINI